MDAIRSCSLGYYVAKGWNYTRETCNNVSHIAFNAIASLKTWLSQWTPRQLFRSPSLPSHTKVICLDDKKALKKLGERFNFAQLQSRLQAPGSFDYDLRKQYPHQLHFSSIRFGVGVCQSTGYKHGGATPKDRSEDVYCAGGFELRLQNGLTYPVEFSGVFDGHGGHQVAEWVAKHIDATIKVYLVQYNPKGLMPAGIKQALKDAFIQVNEELRKVKDQVLPEKTIGSTGVIVIIANDIISAASAGDSRIILNNNGKAVQLTEDAKPNDKEYQKKMYERTGEAEPVWDNKVSGMFTTARAFGDFMYPAIVPNPKITQYLLKDIGPNSHLILSSDGIYDVASTAQIVAAAHAHSDLSPTELATNIVRAAFAAGARDDLTVLVSRI